MCVCFSRQLHAAHFQMRCLAAAAARQKCLLLPLEHGRMLPLLPLQFFVRRRPSFLSVFSSYKHWRCGLLPFQVIAAEGEQKASRALREASEVISESSSALQLRYLQVLLTYLLTRSLFFFLEATRKKSRRLPSSVVVLVLQRRSSTERFFAPKGKFSESETNLFFLFLFFHRHSTQYRRKRIAPSSFHCL